MAEALKEVEPSADEQGRRQAIAEIVRARLNEWQARLDRIEGDALRGVSRALASGDAKLRDLDRTLARVSRDDWTVPGVRRQLEGLRARAQAARNSAMKRVGEMPGTAVEKLASGTRVPLRTLGDRLAAMAKRIEGARNGADAGAPKNGK
jgi:hypothetical protein